MISKRTILSNHPMVNDVQEELDLIEAEQKEAIDSGFSGFEMNAENDGEKRQQE